VYKLKGATPFSGQNMVSRISQFGWVQFYHLISVISGPKFTELSLPNAGGIVVENVLVRFKISSSVLEIFNAEL